MAGNIIKFFLDKLYPNRCVFCGREEVFDESFLVCPRCQKELPYTPEHDSFDGGRYIEYLISPLYYKDLVRSCIVRYKFYNKKLYHYTLATIISMQLEKIDEIRNADYILPVPLSKKRLKQRGYNQSALIAKDLSDMLGIKFDEDILIRLRHTKRQSKLNFTQKQVNVLGAFACTQSLKGKSVILVDDLYTTGATINECAKMLKQVGCSKVYGVTVAIFPKKENKTETYIK